jgi:hypothetical protein
MSRHHEVPSLDQLVAYVEGAATASEAAFVEASLASSSTAQRRVQALRDIRMVLSKPIPEAERIDLVGAVRRAIDRQREPVGFASRCRKFFRQIYRSVLRRKFAWLSFATVAAAALLVLPRLHAPIPADQPAGIANLGRGTDEFRPRSASPMRTEAERWAGLHVYRMDDQGSPKRLAERMRATDGLLFTYTNLGPRPFKYLMVFARVANGDVVWFYPDYRQPGTDPTSIAIREGQTDVELPDIVHHRLASGRLVIYALFTRTPLRVSQVEPIVGGPGGAPPRLPFQESAQHLVQTEVVP